MKKLVSALVASTALLSLGAQAAYTPPTGATNISAPSSTSTTASASFSGSLCYEVEAYSVTASSPYTLTENLSGNNYNRLFYRMRSSEEMVTNKPGQIIVNGYSSVSIIVNVDTQLQEYSGMPAKMFVRTLHGVTENMALDGSGVWNPPVVELQETVGRAGTPVHFNIALDPTKTTGFNYYLHDLSFYTASGFKNLDNPEISVSIKCNP